MSSRYSTRQNSSPPKRARTSLTFGNTSPQKKRIKLSENVDPEQVKGINGHEEESFTIRSFYGKREKNHFPHSPKRKKAVKKVLEKVQDENTDKGKSSQLRYEFHSSGSSADDGSDPSLTKKLQLTDKKKVQLDVKIPKTRDRVRRLQSDSTYQVSEQRNKNPDAPITPVNGKKFFRHRSPASADKSFGSIIVKKGFDVHFVPKRSSRKSLEKNRTNSEKKKASKTKPVDKIKATEKQHFTKIGDQLEMHSEHGSTDIASYDSQHGLNTDGTSLSSRGDVSICDSFDSKPQSSAEIQAHSRSPRKTRQRDDSDLDSLNSAHLLSSQSGQSLSENVNSSDQVDTDSLSLESTEEHDGYVYTASDDLFSSQSGRTTPVQQASSSQQTPSSRTPLNKGKKTSSTLSPARSQNEQPSSQVSPSSKSSCSETMSLISEPASSTSESKSPMSGNGKKLFPIFTKRSTPQYDSPAQKLRSKSSPKGTKSPLASQSPLLKYVRSKDNMEQMIIDAGQMKRYGATQCEVCGMVYTMSEPADETVHNKFHHSMLQALKFTGWKKERVVQEYVDIGCRVIMVNADDPKYATKKVEDVNKIMGQELGFPKTSLAFRYASKAFLFVSENKKIEGCCVCEPITEGYRVVSDSHSGQNLEQPSQRPWCCSDKPEPASIGISRIWVYSQARRKGVATKLLDCVRQWSVYGTLLPKTKMAFSDPTRDGKLLAERYTGTPHFLVYKYM